MGNARKDGCAQIGILRLHFSLECSYGRRWAEWIKRTLPKQYFGSDWLLGGGLLVVECYPDQRDATERDALRASSSAATPPTL
jgi:hypothetical protein